MKTSTIISLSLLLTTALVHTSEFEADATELSAAAALQAAVAEPAQVLTDMPEPKKPDYVIVANMLLGARDAREFFEIIRHNHDIQLLAKAIARITNGLTEEKGRKIFTTYLPDDIFYEHLNGAIKDVLSTDEFIQLNQLLEATPIEIKIHFPGQPDGYAEYIQVPEQFFLNSRLAKHMSRSRKMILQPKAGSILFESLNKKNQWARDIIEDAEYVFSHPTVAAITEKFKTQFAADEQNPLGESCAARSIAETARAILTFFPKNLELHNAINLAVDELTDDQYQQISDHIMTLVKQPLW